MTEEAKVAPAATDVPVLALQQTVFVCGGNRFWIGKERFIATTTHTRAHLCLFPCDIRHSMEGPSLLIGSMVKFKHFEPNDFIVVGIEMHNTTYQVVKDTRRKAPKGREIITRICIDAIDVLEAQREKDDELGRREWMRRGLEHLRGGEHEP